MAGGGLRTAARERLTARSHFPVLIVGAGINGCGLFRELSLQGVDCLLVDRGDFCSGTSAAPSRLIHGGVKYLETGAFRLVAESALERNRLLANAPHFVRPLQAVVPATRWLSGIWPSLARFLGGQAKLANRGALVLRLGLLLYDWYGRHERRMPVSGFLSRRAARASLPSLRPDIVGLGTYYDAMVLAPERLGMELVFDALDAHPRSLAVNHMALVGRQGAEIVVRDELDGSEKRITADLVVNAAGPWIDDANAKLSVERRYIGGTKGSHLLLDHPDLVRELDGRMVYFGADDGRVCLVFPFLGLALVGSTDIPLEDPDKATCDAEEVAYMMAVLRALFPGLETGEAQIVYRYSGVRPLPASDADDPGAISRDHSVPIDEPEGDRPFPLLSLVGGKWTTFRAFSEEVADQVLSRLGQTRRCLTRDLPIGGGHGFPCEAAQRQAWIEQESRRSGLAQERIGTLLERYGTTASGVADHCAAAGDPMLSSLPDYGCGEIAALAENEMVGRLSDLLLRRTTIAITGRLKPAVVEEAAEIVGAALGWDAERMAREVAETLP